MFKNYILDIFKNFIGTFLIASMGASVVALLFTHHLPTADNIALLMAITFYYAIMLASFSPIIKDAREIKDKIVFTILAGFLTLGGILSILTSWDFFTDNELKISVVNKPDYLGAPFYLTCENLETKKMTRIMLQTDYNSPSAMTKKYTYIDFDGKAYPTTPEVDNLVSFDARIDKDTTKGIIFDYSDHTCSMSTYTPYKKDRPSISGFFSWDDANYKDSFMRKMYAEIYKQNNERKSDERK